MHSTAGRVSSSFGGFCKLVLTGTDLGSCACDGVLDPEVKGGVKAGLRRLDGGGEDGRLLSLLRS